MTTESHKSSLWRIEALHQRELRGARTALTKFHTAEQVAKALGVSPRIVPRWIKSFRLAFDPVWFLAGCWKALGRVEPSLGLT
jgi:hypothetical protein